MAARILGDGEDISTMPIEYAPEFTKKYNADICATLGIEVPEDYVAIGAEEEAAEEETEEAATEEAATEENAEEEAAEETEEAAE